jgi:transcriptional regulator with XRE-family HTH domain
LPASCYADAKKEHAWLPRQAGTTRDANVVGLGRVLATLRRSRNLTQEQLAERVGNRSASAISRLEKGSGPVPRESTLRRLAQALDLDGAEAGELFTLAGIETEIRRSPYRNEVHELLVACAAAAQRSQRTLTPLETEELFGGEKVLERFDAAEAVVNLLRVRAGSAEGATPYAVGISLANTDDLFDEEQNGRWEAALQLVLDRELPIIQIFELGEPDHAIAVVSSVLRRLAAQPPGAYQARYFTTDPSRMSPYNVVVAPGMGGLLFFKSRDSDVASGPDTAYTFREGPGLSLLEGQFERLRHKESKRLLNVLSENWEETSQQVGQDDIYNWELALARDEETPGDRLQVTRGLSRLLVPEPLWSRTVANAWGRNGLSEHTIQRYRALRRRRRVAWEAQMRMFRYRTITTKEAVDGLLRGDPASIDTMLGGPDRVPLPSDVRREALRTLLDYLDRGYELALLESRESARIPIFEWIVKDKQVVYLEARNDKEDVLRVTVMPQMLIDVFKDFFEDLWEHLPTPATDQARVKAYLRDQLNRSELRRGQQE